MKFALLTVTGGTPGNGHFQRKDIEAENILAAVNMFNEFVDDWALKTDLPRPITNCHGLTKLTAYFEKAYTVIILLPASKVQEWEEENKMTVKYITVSHKGD